VIVSEHQLSLAIGKEGQNARLAARLSGYKVDIRSDHTSVPEAVVAPEPVEVADGAEVEAPESEEASPELVDADIPVADAVEPETAPDEGVEAGVGEDER
jgi:N utilization substance protein A